LKGEAYASRESIFLYCDTDPEASEPEYRRARFAFDGWYKLYHDGKRFDIANDIEDENPH